MNGRTESGSRFSISVSSQASNVVGLWGDIILIYKSEKNKKPISYVAPVEAFPVIRVNNLGLVTMSEKVGGMNGTYKVTYLQPSDVGLIGIGAAQLDQSNGKYVEVANFIPKWIRPANPRELRKITDSLIRNVSALAATDKVQAVDNFILFFVVKNLMGEMAAQDSMFPLKFFDYINKELDSSLANLITQNNCEKFSVCNGDLLDSKLDENYGHK